jgi:hypothetical protein
MIVDKLMRGLVAACLVGGVACFAGCGQHEAVQATEDWADAVCRCKDAECAIRLSQEGAEKLKKYRNERGTEDEARAVTKASMRARKCIDAAMKPSAPLGEGAAVPAPPPPPGAAVPTPPAAPPAAPSEKK